MRPFIAAGLFVGAAAQGQRITELPGLDTLPPFAMISGYVPYTSPLLKSTHYTFHWIVESTGDPSKDPLVFWVSGFGQDTAYRY